MESCRRRGRGRGALRRRAGAAFQAGPKLLLAGAVLFYVSDFFVARKAFITQLIWNPTAGLPLYFAGQFVLAWSVAFAHEAVEEPG